MADYKIDWGKFREKSLDDLKEDIKTCGDLMNDIEVKMEQKPGRGTRRMLRRKLKKLEAQIRQLILDLAALTPYGPAGPQVKQDVSIVLDEIEQELTHMTSIGFMV
jgi:hypothetical protein